MRKWLTAGVIAAGSTMVTGAALADELPRPTVASVFRMPDPGAIGAATGAVVAVNLLGLIRRRRARREGRPDAG